MCGITGVFAFNEIGRMHLIHLSNATNTLEKRGPDDFGNYLDYNVGLGHRRLAIIDTSNGGHQPMSTVDDRYHIVFNGEIYNYKTLRENLKAQGHTFSSGSDTEVLLKLYVQYGESCVSKLDGFFSFAIRDKEEDSLFIARDRFGIKPLLYFCDEDKVLFASEMKALIAYNIRKEIDYEALSLFLELNYTPAPKTMLRGVKKLLPGHAISIKGNKTKVYSYYKTSVIKPYKYQNYEEAQELLRQKLENSVKARLVSDVPIGTFLSGGIDSSVISTIAAQNVPSLDTFSIGYKDNPFFDETSYAELVANKIGSNHHVFKLSNNDLLEHVDDILNYMDEPFADSSAIPVYILSKKTRNHVTVALSGDGADEIFSGYNKHSGWLRSMDQNFANQVIRSTAQLWSALPKSRGGKLANLFRQLEKYSKGLQMDLPERYWFWASITSKQEVQALLHPQVRNNIMNDALIESRSKLTSAVGSYNDFNDFLLNDVDLVLTNDMLTKVDSMSMANSLEVRVPFLQHDLIEFAFSLPPAFKIDRHGRKKILRDAYRNTLPQELYNRGKKGFEVPLLDWLKNELLSALDQKLFNQKRLEQQGIFESEKVMSLRKKLLSANPGDTHAKVWALFTFQHWYDRYFDC